MSQEVEQTAIFAIIDCWGEGCPMLPTVTFIYNLTRGLDLELVLRVLRDTALMSTKSTTLRLHLHDRALVTG